MTENKKNEYGHILGEKVGTKSSTIQIGIVSLFPLNPELIRPCKHSLLHESRI